MRPKHQEKVLEILRCRDPLLNVCILAGSDINVQASFPLLSDGLRELGQTIISQQHQGRPTARRADVPDEWLSVCRQAELHRAIPCVATQPAAAVRDSVVKPDKRSRPEISRSPR